MEVKLIFLPDVEDVIYSVEPLESHGEIASPRPGLAVLGQEPKTLHVNKVRYRSTGGVGSREQAHRRQCIFIFVVPKLVLGRFGVDVTVPGIEQASLFHHLCCLLGVALVLIYPSLRMVEVNALRVELNGSVNIFQGLDDIPAEVVVVMLRQEIQRRSLAL